jgi:hypothetical protein
MKMTQKNVMREKIELKFISSFGEREISNQAWDKIVGNCLEEFQPRESIKVA